MQLIYASSQPASHDIVALVLLQSLIAARLKDSKLTFTFIGMEAFNVCHATRSAGRVEEKFRLGLETAIREGQGGKKDIKQYTERITYITLKEYLQKEEAVKVMGQDMVESLELNRQYLYLIFNQP